MAEERRGVGTFVLERLEEPGSVSAYAERIAERLRRAVAPPAVRVDPSTVPAHVLEAWRRATTPTTQEELRRERDREAAMSGGFVEGDKRLDLVIVDLQGQPVLNAEGRANTIRDRRPDWRAYAEAARRDGFDPNSGILGMEPRAGRTSERWNSESQVALGSYGGPGSR